MFKTYSKFCACILFCIFNLFVVSASAIDLDEATRTVTADSSGKTVVLSPEQVNVVNVYLILHVVHVILVGLQKQIQTLV